MFAGRRRGVIMVRTALQSPSYVDTPREARGVDNGGAGDSIPCRGIGVPPALPARPVSSHRGSAAGPVDPRSAV